MAKYKTKFYGGYKLEGNVSDYLVTYLNRFFRTIHIKRNVEKIKSVPDWKQYSFYGDLGYEGELYVNPDDKTYGEKHLLMVNRYCHFKIEKKDDGYYLVWNGNEEFYHYEVWIKYLHDRFFHKRRITLTGVMLSVGTCERDAYYMVIYNDYMTKHYARDVRELENVRNKFKDCKVIMDILDTLSVL